MLNVLRSKQLDFAFVTKLQSLVRKIQAGAIPVTLYDVVKSLGGNPIPLIWVLAVVLHDADHVWDPVGPKECVATVSPPRPKADGARADLPTPSETPLRGLAETARFEKTDWRSVVQRAGYKRELKPSSKKSRSESVWVYAAALLGETHFVLKHEDLCKGIVVRLPASFSLEVLSSRSKGARQTRMELETDLQSLREDAQRITLFS